MNREMDLAMDNLVMSAGLKIEEIVSVQRLGSEIRISILKDNRKDDK